MSKSEAQVNAEELAADLAEALGAAKARIAELEAQLADHAHLTQEYVRSVARIAELMAEVDQEGTLSARIAELEALLRRVSNDGTILPISLAADICDAIGPENPSSHE